MKPAAFEYARPSSLDEVLTILAANAGDAKVLAGGQSLMPLLNYRMLRPAVLVDINRLTELSFIREDGAGVRIGALTRHYSLETSPLIREHFPVIREAMKHVAHLAVRNRGSIGGSLSHADPAAELPMLAMLLDARIHTRSASEPRVHEAKDFFVAPLASVLKEDEVVTEIELGDLQPGTGWGFEEFSRRSGDFAIAAVAATLTLSADTVSSVRIALMGVDSTPVRLWNLESRLIGEILSESLVTEAAQLASEAVQPDTDLKASAQYRRHLVRTLTERALLSARDRARAALQ